jgi:hypothetical protein
MRLETAPPQRALPAGAISPAVICEPQDAPPAASADSAEDDAELLADLVIALVDLPGDAYADIMTAIPDPLYHRLDRYMEQLLEEADSQP